MMSKNPLSYLSMQCVLQHLGASARFHIVPSNSPFQNLENSLPLKIDILSLEGTEILVNNTTYRLGVIQVFNNEAPEEIRHENSYEGVSHDVDRYGFKVHEVVEKEPGEIIIDNRSKDVESGPSYEYMNYKLKALEKEYKHKERQNVGQLDPRGQSSLKSLEKEIKNYKNKLIPYNLRQENAPSQSTNYIQLTISNDAGKRVERINYTKSIYVAMKYLIEKLLRERRETIKIGIFEIGYHDLLRLPSNLNIKIEELDIHENHKDVLKAIEPILIKGSLPLKSISIHESPSMNNYIIQTATLLRLGCNWGVIDFKKICNHRLRMWCNYLPRLKITRLVRDWLKHERHIGTCYSFNAYFDAEWTISEIAELKGARIDEKKQTEYSRTIFFSMGDTLELKVSCTRTQQDRPNWDFIMEVQEK